MNVVCKKLENLDVDLLLKLTELDGQYMGESGVNRFTMRVIHHLGWIQLAMVGEEIAGVMQVLPHGEKGYHLFGMYVTSPFRGCGVGRKLMTVLREELTKCKAHFIDLTVSPENTIALSLYQKFGFQITRTVSDYYGSGEDRHLMEWKCQFQDS
jgi:ribosomal protein S18 acetylase RimI-like enzyme